MGAPWQREKFSLSVAKQVFSLNLFPMPLTGAEASDLLATPLNVPAAPVTARRVPQTWLVIVPGSISKIRNAAAGQRTEA